MDAQGAGLAALLQVFMDICRKRKLRLTPQRMEIFREIAVATDHPMAEDLHERLKQRMPTLSLDTVYRTLGTLERFGVVIRMHQADTPARYDAIIRKHHHFVCRLCNRIHDLDWHEFDRLSAPAHALDLGEIEMSHVQMRGICKECISKQ